MRSQQFFITGMTCAACSATITKQVQKVDGVEKVNVNLLANKMSVDYDEQKTSDDKIISAVIEAGYGASVSQYQNTSENSFRKEWQTRKQNESDMANNMKNGDVAFGISHSGRTKAVVDAMRSAKQSGATTISLTSFTKSLLYTESDYSISVYAD